MRSIYLYISIVYVTFISIIIVLSSGQEGPASGVSLREIKKKTGYTTCPEEKPDTDTEEAKGPGIK